MSDWDNGGTVRLRVLERPGGWAPTDRLVGWGTGHGSGLSRTVWQPPPCQGCLGGAGVWRKRTYSSCIFKWHLIRLSNNFPVCLKTNKNQFPLLELSSSWQTPREVPLGPHCANQGVKG